MTLSRFLRDYLYIPLDGNRHGVPRHVCALVKGDGRDGAIEATDFAAVPLLRRFLATLSAETRVVLIFPPRHHSNLPPAGSTAARSAVQGGVW